MAGAGITVLITEIAAANPVQLLLFEASASRMEAFGSGGAGLRAESIQRRPAD